MSNQKQLQERHAVEKYVRQKNTVYHTWRIRFTYPELDNICTELMMRFGALPHWEKYVQARRRGNWAEAALYEIEQRAYRATIREWALSSGHTTFENQSAQLLKFYYAWHRWQYERRHGPITRKYARQMG